MANKHAIVRLDNVSALYNGALTRSIEYFVDSSATDIDNGRIVALDGLIDGEREVYKAIAPTATSSPLVLTCGVELMYDETTYHGLEDYTNKAGKPFRGVIVRTGDTFSVTAEALSGTPAKGSYVTVDTTTQMVVKTSVTTETVVGKIIDVDVVGADTYYVIEVA